MNLVHYILQEVLDNHSEKKESQKRKGRAYHSEQD